MGSKVQDLTGQSFGRLNVLFRTDNEIHGHVRYACRCACGKEVSVRGRHLRNGKTKSCGCLNADNKRGNTYNLKHGYTSGGISPEYHIWTQMIQRCRNHKNQSYSDYGGRGIQVCLQWQGEHGFESFIHDLGPRPSSKHSLDRHPNNNGNYESGNCRWATRSEQQKNRRKVMALGNFTNDEIRAEFNRRFNS